MLLASHLTIGASDSPANSGMGQADAPIAKKAVSGTSTYYLYDGGVPVIEMNSSGTTTAINAFGPDGLVARQQSGSWIQYQFDQQGNVAQRLNASQAVLSSSVYDAYGVESNAGGTPTDPFAYNAKWGYQFDRETSLYACMYRLYDPAQGRWINRDPIGFSGGVNLYGYCASGPVNSADTSGLMSLFGDSVADEGIDAAHDALAYAGTVSLHAGLVRDSYLSEVRGLPNVVGHSPARDALRDKWQPRTPEPYGSMLPKRPQGQTGGAGKSNPTWNKAAKIAKGLGICLVGVAVAKDVYDIASASPEDRGAVAAEAAGGWAGAIAGGYAGAKAGAAIGAFFGNPIAGAIVGGFVGGILGGMGGRAAADGLTYRIPLRP